jgi:hypothetical protein
MLHTFFVVIDKVMFLIALIFQSLGQLVDSHHNSGFCALWASYAGYINRSLSSY